MTFGTVGNATQPFRRMLDAIDAAAASGLLCEPTVIQIGNNAPTRAGSCVRFLPAASFQEHLFHATLVICHGGAGTIIQACELGHRPIVFPRRRALGEVIDDHQFELVRALAESGAVVSAHTTEDLLSTLSDLQTTRVKNRRIGDSRLAQVVAAAIAEVIADCRAGGRY